MLRACMMLLGLSLALAACRNDPPDPPSAPAVPSPPVPEPKTNTDRRDPPSLPELLKEQTPRSRVT